MRVYRAAGRSEAPGTKFWQHLEPGDIYKKNVAICLSVFEILIMRPRSARRLPETARCWLLQRAIRRPYRRFTPRRLKWVARTKVRQDHAARAVFMAGTSVTSTATSWSRSADRKSNRSTTARVGAGPREKRCAAVPPCDTLSYYIIKRRAVRSALSSG